MQSIPRTSSPALRQGLIFGVIVGVVQVAFIFIGEYVALGLIGLVINLLIFLISGLLAGRRTSTQTGKMSSGLLAGVLSGLIGSLISSIVTVILVLINIDAYRQSAQQTANQQGLHITYTNALVIQGIIFVLVISIVIYALLALGGGAIGGYMGRSRAQVPPPNEYQESMFAPPPPPPQQGQ